LVGDLTAATVTVMASPPALPARWFSCLHGALVFGISSRDPLTFVVPIVLALVVREYAIPAHRAAAIDHRCARISV
jgi:hypothetical protein